MQRIRSNQPTHAATSTDEPVEVAENTTQIQPLGDGRDRAVPPTAAIPNAAVPTTKAIGAPQHRHIAGPGFIGTPRGKDAHGFLAHRFFAPMTPEAEAAAGGSIEDRRGYARRWAARPENRERIARDFGPYRDLAESAILGIIISALERKRNLTLDGAYAVAETDRSSEYAALNPGLDTFRANQIAELQRSQGLSASEALAVYTSTGQELARAASGWQSEARAIRQEIANERNAAPNVITERADRDSEHELAHDPTLILTSEENARRRRQVAEIEAETLHAIRAERRRSAESEVRAQKNPDAPLGIAEDKA